jgi:hypothetical protein
MSDDTAQIRPQDAQRVNVHQKHELRYWSENGACRPSS